MPWPPGFARIPDEEWTRAPIDPLAAGYDAVGGHGWYANLDPTARELDAALSSGSIALDYSGGTGLLIRRLLARVGDRDVGILDVDSSPKFLRFALDRFRDEPRVAFRLIRWLKEAKRLQYVHEAIGEPLARRGVEAVVSANAIHLYYDLDATLASWARVLRPGGRVLVQSGNVLAEDARIIDDTVEAVHEEALALARSDPRYAAYRAAAHDVARQAAHDALRRKFFLPPRPVRFYLDELAHAGLDVVDVRTRRISVDVAEWAEFLCVYHEGVLGWVGGSRRVEGREPSAADLAARMAMIREGLARAIGAPTFDATWTYVTCVKRG